MVHHSSNRADDYRFTIANIVAQSNDKESLSVSDLLESLSPAVTKSTRKYFLITYPYQLHPLVKPVHQPDNGSLYPLVSFAASEKKVIFDVSFCCCILVHLGLVIAWMLCEWLHITSFLISIWLNISLKSTESVQL